MLPVRSRGNLDRLQAAHRPRALRSQLFKTGLTERILTLVSCSGRSPFTAILSLNIYTIQMTLNHKITGFINKNKVTKSILSKTKRANSSLTFRRSVHRWMWPPPLADAVKGLQHHRWDYLFCAVRECAFSHGEVDHIGDHAPSSSCWECSSWSGPFVRSRRQQRQGKTKGNLMRSHCKFSEKVSQMIHVGQVSQHNPVKLGLNVLFLVRGKGGQ